MKCVCKTQMMHRLTIRNYKQVKSSLTLCMMFYVASKKGSPTTCYYQIFDENQNPVDMHTSIMCINIIQNIKAVAPKL